MNKAINAALADGETARRLLNAYIEPQPMSPGDLGAWLRSERERLGSLIKKLDIRADGA